MSLNNLRPARGANRKNKRVGRGMGSGHGKTATRGYKGQKSRSGTSIRPGFEGGQMPLYRRLPKRGFLPHGGKHPYAIVNLKALAGFAANAVIDPDSLTEAGLIKRADRARVKVLGDGEITRALTVRVHAVSEAARAKIEGNGGRVELLTVEAATS
ncbi:MAG: 50S ribosomal protein L15 [Gammaproteobacteria bacterium]